MNRAIAWLWFIALILVVLAAASLLTSCASTNDVSIVEKEMEAVTAIADAEASRVESVKEAHSESVQAVIETDGATSGEKILGIALLGEKFADAAESKLDLILAKFKRATLGTDVQVAGLETVADGIVPVSFAITTKAAIENQKGNAVIQTENGDVSVSESLNTETNHTTTAGDENSVSSSSDDDKNTEEVVAEE